MSQIYLDYNATTPIAPEVADAMRPFLDDIFGNPSSQYEQGFKAKMTIENARKQVAGMLGCFQDEVFFTSGGTESNNWAIKGYAFANKEKGNHIITSSIEHPSVKEVMYYLEKNGFQISFLPVDENGVVDTGQLENEITQKTILVSIMHANNETGVIQPIEAISSILKQKNIAFHTDAAQSAGKIPVKTSELGVDLLSIAGHKLYAPKGIGVLYIRRGIKIEKLIHGANHEQNMRAGTENILEIAGLGKACELISNHLGTYSEKYEQCRDRLENGILSGVNLATVNGRKVKRLPNTLSISFKGIEAALILSELQNISASAGAACHSDKVTISEVLEAMHADPEFAIGTIRFSTGRSTTFTEIDDTIKKICTVVKNLRGEEMTAGLDEEGQIKLTHFTKGLGCACKLRPQDLEEVLKKMPVPFDKNVLVGANTSDDAAVYKINGSQAIIQTVDFFTPIADDPYIFGQIAAANALSDIYAMGGKPLFALNIAAFPSKRLPLTVLEQILAGANEIANKAGISIIGGHTIEDNEPKFGMCVTGIIHPEKVLKNTGAKPGDSIILTKPIGTGILTTALKRGLLSAEKSRELYASMISLNDIASQLCLNYEIHACTDVTGFGLIGHLSEVLTHSQTDAEIIFDQIPFLEGVFTFAETGIVPGGTLNNLDHFGKKTTFSGDISEAQKLVFADAQTSGGLLLFLPENQAENLVDNLYKSGCISSKIIGKITGHGNGIIKVC